MTKFYAALAAAVLVAMIGGTAIYVQFQETANTCDASGAVGAKIGGPFELLNVEARTVTDVDVIDRPSLVYFGYTFCPDVCPFDMSRNAEAVDILKEAGHDVQPVFITIDPERDTPDVMADYQFNMHPDLVALTGSAEQIKAAADAYKVYYARGTGDDEFYLMDHTAFTYLMMPGNELAGFFRREDSAEKIAETTACLIENH